jgi:hypothetical protein
MCSQTGSDRSLTTRRESMCGGAAGSQPSRARRTVLAGVAPKRVGAGLAVKGTRNIVAALRAAGARPGSFALRPLDCEPPRPRAGAFRGQADRPPPARSTGPNPNGTQGVSHRLEGAQS